MNLPSLPNFSNFDPQLFAGEALLSPTVQAGLAIFFFLFFIVLLAISRRYLIHASMKGLYAGLFIGVLLIVGIEAGFVYSLKQITDQEKGKYIPPNIKAMLFSGQQQVTQVLGAQTEKTVPTAQSVVSDYEVLGRIDSKLVKDSICTPLRQDGATEGQGGKIN